MSEAKTLATAFRRQLRGFEAITSSADLLALSFEDGYELSKRAIGLVEMSVKVGHAIYLTVDPETVPARNFKSQSYGFDNYRTAPVNDALKFAVDDLGRVEMSLESHDFETALAGMNNVIQTVYGACDDLTLGLQQPFPPLKKLAKDVAKLLKENAGEISL